MEFLAIEMGICHAQGFWVVCCWLCCWGWAVLLAPAAVTRNLWTHPRTPGPTGKALVSAKLLLMFAICGAVEGIVRSSQLLFINVGCYWSHLSVLISTKEQGCEDKGCIQFLQGEGVRGSCPARMEFSVGGEELCFLWRDDTPGPGEAFGSGHAFPAPVSLLTLGVLLQWPLKHRAEHFLGTTNPAFAWQTMVAARLAHTALVMVLFWEKATKKLSINHGLQHWNSADLSKPGKFNGKFYILVDY